MKQANHSHQLCSVSLLGNLVTKPDIRYRANPVSALTEITLATRSKWLDKKTNKYKEWTSYHHVKVEGVLVEQALLHADKGDIVLIHGYLSNIKPSHTKPKSISSDRKTNATANHPAIVHATFVQRFNKGYTQSINQINCSAQITSAPQLMTTEYNKTLAQVNVTINQHIYSTEQQCWQIIPVDRALHLWGKQALYLHEKAAEGDDIVIEGKLSYTSNAEKSQFIEGNKIHLFKK
ncbi:MAG: single-stranded DNA-binding protein [Colwellia sp.]